MATRNRTPLFRKYRDALREVRTSATTASGRQGSGPVIEMANAPFLNQRQGYNMVSTVDADMSGAATIGLPPAWVDISEAVSTDMQKVRGKITDLIKAHAKALMPTFNETKAEQQTVEILTQEITRLLKKCEQSLQRLSAGYGPTEDANIRKNVQRSLATDLQSLSLEFRKQQKSYLRRLQQQQQDVSSGVDLGVNLSDRNSRATENDSDSGFTAQKMSRIKKSENLTAEREKEISQIVESVNDLAQIMKDLSVLVIDQGTIVDRIDYNIQNVAASVEQGVKQLEKAERTQKKGGMVLCIMILICLCVFMIFMLIVKEIFL